MEEFNTSGGLSSRDDDMDSFAEECERRLAAEHEQIAAESKKEYETELTEDKPQALELQANENVKRDTFESEDKSDKSKADDDLSQLMRTESYRQQVQEDDRQNESEDEEKMPTWLRLLFSAMLLILGASGVWILVLGAGLSDFAQLLCLVEALLCLLTAVGLNVSAMSKQETKKTIMRTTLWILFVFYCLNVADKLFLHRMIENGFAFGDFMQYAKGNIDFDILGGFSELTWIGITEIILYTVPYAFCVPVLMKSYRNIILYFLYMTCTFLAISTLQIVSMSNCVSLTECLICLAASAVVYIIIMLPPVQHGLRKIGLMEWAEINASDDDD